MATQSDNDRPQSSGGSSEVTITNLRAEIKQLKAKMEKQIKEHAEEMEKAEKNERELSAQLKDAKSKMKEAEENQQKTSNELKAAKSKVSELEEEIKKLNELVRDDDSSVSSEENSEDTTTPQTSPTSSPPNAGHEGTPLQPQTSPNSANEHTAGGVVRSLSFKDAAENSQLREEIKRLKEENKQLQEDKKLLYALLPPKPKAVYEGIQTVRKFKKAPNPEDVHVKNYVRYFDPNVPNQDECVKGHPLREIARRCASISTSKDEGHIYVALLKVDGQRKHYVGKAQDWMNRWQTDSTSHEKQIQKAVQLLLTQIQQLLEGELSRLLDLQHCDIEMGVAILKHFQNTEQCKQIIVAYKIQCSLSKTDTVSRSYLNPYEQHFMNAFSDSASKKLNAMNADTSHSKDACPFSGYNETCKSFLEKVLHFIEKDWQQSLTHSRCIPPAVHPGEPLRHPLMDIVQRVVRASESDSKSTGARVHIALISISKSGVIEFKHYIRVTKCNGKTIAGKKCILLQGDTRCCEIFNYWCTDKGSAIQELTAIFKAAAARSENPQVHLYTIAAKKDTPVVNDHEMRSVQQHFMNALDGLMVGGSSTLVNCPEGGDRGVHRGDVCPFSSNIQLECSVHLAAALKFQSNPICSLWLNPYNNRYQCKFKVLIHSQRNHAASLEYSQENDKFTCRRI